MPKVLVVNNYPARDRAGKLESCIEGNGGAVTAVEWGDASASLFDSFDGVVLSGSPDMMTERRTEAKFLKERDAILESNAPILGICFGHQLVARAFEAEVVKDRKPVQEMIRTTVLTEDRLFAGLPKSLMLLESRHEVVKSLPAGFTLLAKSATSAIAAMKSRSRPIYGVQFHPERYSVDHPEGNAVLGNFVGMLK
ncbi:MAG: gamma-glutamyl-gamma-aminobutyrate hydrolase family protein [Nitrososphaerota archaeon]|jgi:GMP synthase (glutamine-hydrolysing)|nr:gamma-glutamyl-gamma-aminobutyrate hydrolase family protein [Nitrososphaerota archaeon]